MAQEETTKDIEIEEIGEIGESDKHKFQNVKISTLEKSVWK